MEFLLLWWDELDDYLGACRHLAGSAVEELSNLRAPLTAGASILGALLLAAHVHAQVVTLSGHWL